MFVCLFSFGNEYWSVSRGCKLAFTYTHTHKQHKYMDTIDEVREILSWDKILSFIATWDVGFRPPVAWPIISGEWKFSLLLFFFFLLFSFSKVFYSVELTHFTHEMFNTTTILLYTTSNNLLLHTENSCLRRKGNCEPRKILGNIWGLSYFFKKISKRPWQLLDIYDY